MSTKQYNTTRNKELKYWTKTISVPATKYDKEEMLQKVQELQKAQPHAKIWPSLATQLLFGKRLTYKQQSVIDTAYDRMKKRKVVKR